MDINVITEVLASTVRIATPLLLMALGGLLCQKAGVFNIALEGFALIGAFAGVAFVQVSGGNVYIGLICAAICGIIYSSIFAVFITKFEANHIISSIAMNMLSAGLTSYLLRAVFGVQGRLAPDIINKLNPINIPILKDIPILSFLSGQSIVTYFSILVTIIIYVVLFKTKTGLSICAVGESEDAARTAGISPNKVKWKTVLISGALCAIAGAYLSTVIVSQFSENMIQGRGSTAFTSVVFGNSHPIWVALVTLLFGFADAIGIRIELIGMKISPAIISMFPFVLAIITLGISSYMTMQKNKGIRTKKISKKR